MKNPVKTSSQQDTVQKFIVLWEKKIKPDAVAVAEAFVDPQKRLDAIAFLSVIESRVMAQIVLHVEGVEVDKQAAKSVQRIS